MERFKVGDKLKAIDYYTEEYGLEYVTITSINEENQVYHWEADLSESHWEIPGKLSSGYYFKDAELFVEDLANKQQDLDPEFNKLISENFNDLI